MKILELSPNLSANYIIFSLILSITIYIIFINLLKQDYPKTDK